MGQPAIAGEFSNDLFIDPIDGVQLHGSLLTFTHFAAQAGQSTAEGPWKSFVEDPEFTD